ncbi:alpha/beta fold hydrolase [Dactylosporangium sp. NPDC000555]|uniref:thioesterase II family protein n=1 Tax=Dactylosporangium sp. NPDC000555 TaxID=3154260 RepID=UPI00331BEAA1
MNDESLWFRRFEAAATAANRLVCFPHAGGAASYFLPVARALAPDVDVVSVQYPGRQDRRGEPCIDDINVLADRVHQAMRSWSRQTLTLFGHSMGAVIAFEVARRIRRDRPDQSLRLIVSGRRAPHVHKPERVHLGDDARIAAEIRSLGGTEAALLRDPEVLAMIMPTLRSDYRAVETYRYAPGGPRPCPITVFTGDRDPHTTVDEAREWEQYSQEPFGLKVFEGGHFFVSSRSAEVLAALAEHFAGAARGAR